MTRLRLGHATAVLASMWLAEDAENLTAADVFPDLKEPEEVAEEVDEEANAGAILMAFKVLAGRQKAAEA